MITVNKVFRNTFIIAKILLARQARNEWQQLPWKRGKGKHSWEGLSSNVICGFWVSSLFSNGPAKTFEWTEMTGQWQIYKRNKDNRQKKMDI